MHNLFLLGTNRKCLRTCVFSMNIPIKAKIHLCIYVAYAVCKYVIFSTFNALNVFAVVRWKNQVNLIIFKWYNKKFDLCRRRYAIAKDTHKRSH